MQTAADATRTAIVEARAADATKWAPAELRAAERASRDALTARRVEDVKLWPIPDAEPVVAAYAGAERAARDAMKAARDRRATAARTAEAALLDGARAVAATAAVARAIYLGPERRGLLARARSLLDEARTYQRDGDLRRAAAAADLARTLAGQVDEHAAAVAARYADGETISRWRRWREDTVAWSRRSGGAAIIVSKEAHTLTLFVRGQPVRTYQAELGFNWIADKAREGDGATPEGRYRVVARMANLSTLYHKALLLDFPNADDRKEFTQARRRGELPASARIGGLIEIHGGGGRGQDWTNGCVALTHADIDDLFARVRLGTPVTIIGSDQYGSIAEFAARGGRAAAERRP